MLEKIREYLYSSIGFYTTLFVAAWLSAWFYNGHEGTKFDVNALRDMYVWLMSQLNATHLINSKWNSPNGVKP